jgi:hypothetical protein
MKPKAPRPDLAAHERATRLAFPEVVARLTEILGSRLVAYIASVRETRAVREWAVGGRHTRVPEAEGRLRLALRIALMLTDRDSNAVAQAWFQNMNPQLDDRAPAALLRDGVLADVGPEVISAARAFLVGG